MKAVFIGSVIFSAKMLKVLIKSDLELIGVITKKNLIIIMIISI